MGENDSKEQIISHYRIIKEIGHGGFGRVYQAQNTELEDHVVAIKRLYVNEPRARERFRQEARVLLKLKNPYILPFIDFFSDEDGPCLVTYYAGYGSLQDRINQSPGLLPMEEVRNILSQVGQALQYIHEQKVIHCDLKPGNILFNTPGKALLADFGIAKIVADVSMERGEIIGRGTGTPAYMAPEQIKGKPTPKSDQYAFACIIYELLTGRTPFKGSWYLVQQQHLTEPPADPRVLNHDIPELMAMALLKALAKNPDDRHADMNTLLAALGVRTAQETSQLSQKDFETLLDKGALLSQRGRIEDALAIYNQAIEHDSKSVKAFCGRANTLITQPKPEVDALAAALTDYNQALRLDRAFIPAYIGKGDVLYLLKRYRTALKVYQTAVNMAPDLALYLKIANIHIELKEAEKALAAYEDAMRYGANPIKTRYKKIDMMVNLGRFHEVVKEYDQIIRLSSDQLAACHEKKEFLFSIRRHDEAFVINEILAMYEQLIRLKQGAIEVYDEEIEFLEKLVDGNDNKRLVIYDRIINLVPNEVKLHVYYKKAALLEQLNRFNEVSAIYDRIIELAPDDITIHRKKLNAFERLGWPEDVLEDALMTCNLILKQVPNDLGVYCQKRYLHERLKQYDQVVVTCDKYFKLDPKSHEAHHQKGQALEMLEKTHKRKKNNVLSVRLTPIPSRYLKALNEYDIASQLAPDNLDYRESREKLLRYLWKCNQANLQISKNRLPTVSRLFWLLSFLILPTLINTGIGTLLVAIWQHPEIWMGVALGAFCISIFGAVVVNLNDKPYHLYNAFLLFYPISCFTIGWLIVVFLIFRPEMSVSFLFSLVLTIIIIFTVNAFMYFFIDVYEEQTFVFIGIAIMIVVVGILTGVEWLFQEISKAHKAWQEQQKITAQKAKAALSKKVATRQGLLPKASRASSRNVKNSSSRLGKSFKKPILPPSSKRVSLKQANIPKKTIVRNHPNKRQIYRR